MFSVAVQPYEHITLTVSVEMTRLLEAPCSTQALLVLKIHDKAYFSVHMCHQLILFSTLRYMVDT